MAMSGSLQFPALERDSTDHVTELCGTKQASARLTGILTH